MADNFAVTAGTGTTVATDDVAGVHYQRVKLVDGTLDASTAIAAGGGVEAGALRVTLASDSTGVVSIDDNGGTITVDGTVAVTNAGITSIDGKITVCNTGAVVLAAGTALAGKVGIDQVTANANEVVLKTGSTTAVTSGTAANCKVEATIAAAQTVAVTNAGTFAVQAAAVLGAETTKVIGTVNDKVADGDLITLGAKADNKSTATDTTAVSAMSVLKEISYMEQNPASRAVTNAGTFATQNSDALVAATFVVKTVDFTASQTAQTIWTPAGGKKFVITDMVISASAAGTLTVFDATNNTTLRVNQIFLAANGGAVVNYRKPYVSATADNVLKYTTGSGVAGSITVSGYEI